MNSIEEVLGSLGATSAALSPHERQELDGQGFTVLPNVMDARWLTELRDGFEAVAAENQHPAGGKETGTRHVKGLIEHGTAFGRVCTHPRILAAVHHVLGREFRMADLHGRDPLPGFGQQGLHTDWMPLTHGQPFVVVTTLWMLNDFTATNGATRVVPRSHHSAGPIPKHLADSASHHREEIIVTAPAGCVLVFNGHTWHSGTRNTSSRSRRALQCLFTVRESSRFGAPDKPVPEHLSPAARYILGH